MAEILHDDITEHILIRLEVEDLIRCKRVCKSWRSLIASTRFVNRHLNHHALRNRRIILACQRSLLFGCYDYLVGSSNGLVCICSVYKHKVLVGNPLTREVRYLELPPRIRIPICWGFGYDSSTDDYKLIFGSWTNNFRTRFHVFSLKSNAWKDIGVVIKYTYILRDCVLSNGALHWIASDKNMKRLILSYDLCKDEFREIPHPGKCIVGSYPGIIKECLCTSCYFNLKRLLKPLPNDQKTCEIVNSLKSPGFFYDDNDLSFSSASKHPECFRWNYIHAPVFVQSLVSPHVVNEMPSDNKRSIYDHVLKLISTIISRINSLPFFHASVNGNV